MTKLPSILPAPPVPLALAASAKWLSGEGAGSWFVVEEADDSTYKIARFSPTGNLECEGLFSKNQQINLHEDYIISYPSHCALVTLEQGGKSIQLVSAASE